MGLQYTSADLSGTAAVDRNQTLVPSGGHSGGVKPFTVPALADYLRQVHGTRVANVRVTPMGGGRQGDKGYGYGVPLRVDYELDGELRRAVLESVRAGPFGHEHMADRAQSLLWAHGAFNRLPSHVASLDVGAVRSGGELVPLGNAEEFFMLAEFVEGREYADDLLRLKAGEPLEAAGPRAGRRALRLPRGDPRCRTGSRACTCAASASCSATASASSASPTAIPWRYERAAAGDREDAAWPGAGS